jgi:hypothetical protein
LSSILLAESGDDVLPSYGVPPLSHPEHFSPKHYLAPKYLRSGFISDPLYNYFKMVVYHQARYIVTYQRQEYLACRTIEWRRPDSNS